MTPLAWLWYNTTINPAGGVIQIGGHFFMKSFTKIPESDEALATKLIGRGLIVDRPTILDALKAVGYFRLTGYLHPFKIPGTDNYRPGTTFDRLWSIYTFDRKLRLMAMDALARIEIAIRAQIVKGFSAAFPSNAFAYIEHMSLPGITTRRHTELLNLIHRAVKQSENAPDIRHLKSEYGVVDYPPIWNVLEHAPFGLVTLFYEGLAPQVKQGVANVFFMQPNAFGGVLMTFKNARNLCAHHSRFWNQHIQSRIATNLGVRPELNPLVDCLKAQPTKNFTTIFSVLSLCAHCLAYVRPQSQWRKRCAALLKTADLFILHGMGVPIDWQTRQLWEDACK